MQIYVIDVMKNMDLIFENINVSVKFLKKITSVLQFLSDGRIKNHTKYYKHVNSDGSVCLNYANMH